MQGESYSSWRLGPDISRRASLGYGIQVLRVCSSSLIALEVPDQVVYVCVCVLCGWVGATQPGSNCMAFGRHDTSSSVDLLRLGGE